MSEHKVDPERYAGMTQQEAEKAQAEDERRAINEHPLTVAAVEAVEGRERARKAEEQRQARAAATERRETAEAEMEEYRQQQLRAWTAQGGSEDHFEEVWPDLRRQYLQDKAGLISHSEKFQRSNLSGMRL